jgi:hypothetical protein
MHQIQLHAIFLGVITQSERVELIVSNRFLSKNVTEQTEDDISSEAR